MNPRLKWGGGSVLVAAAVAVVIATGSDHDPTCTGAYVTTATFASRLRSSTAGEKLCLLNGDYGTFTGTDKAITITAKEGQTGVAFSDFEFRAGDRDFTLTGSPTTRITTGGGYVAGNTSDCSDPPLNITIAYADVTDVVVFDHFDVEMNFLLDHTTHNNVVSDGGRIRILSEPCQPASHTSGVTIRNAELDGGPADGIQSYLGFTVEDSRFTTIEEDDHRKFHTDSIQWFGDGPAETIIRRNYFCCGSNGIAAYDGAGNGLIEDNVIEDTPTGRCLELYSDNRGHGDDPTTIQWNTLADGCTMALDAKPADPDGSGTIIRNNIIEGGISQAGGSTAGVQENNMVLSGARGDNFNGTPFFVGPLSTWAGYRLPGESAGTGGATDGSNVGARIPAPPAADCAQATPYVADGPDPWGGCFPGPETTGVPEGTVLTAYAGSCTISADDAVIDSKAVDCEGGLIIDASGVVIQNSLICCKVATLDDTDSVKVIDTTLDAGAINGSRRTRARGRSGTATSTFCGSRRSVGRAAAGAMPTARCEDSYFHGQDEDEAGDAHQSGLRQGGGGAVGNGQEFVHNSIGCDAPLVDDGDGDPAGCSADVTGYGDFETQQNNYFYRNLLLESPEGAYCAYGGSSGSSNGAKPFPFGTNNVWRGNSCTAPAASAHRSRR